jgi:hypothetical protein
VWLFALLPVLLVAIGAFVAISQQRKATRRAPSGAGGGQAPKGEPIRWDDDAPVVVAEIDGAPVVIGRYWLYEGDKNNIYLAAFDGLTFQRRWKAGPFGDVSANNAHIYTFFAVAGPRVAVSDYASMLHILDLATGGELLSTRLSDRVQRVCAAPGGEARVWAQVADERHVMVDLATGDASLAERPSWCPDEVDISRDGSACWHSDFLRKRLGRATCLAPDGLGRSEGFQPEYVLREASAEAADSGASGAAAAGARGSREGDGDRVVALGTKHPGTRLPMAAGYLGGKPVWVRLLVDDPTAAVEGTPRLVDLAYGHLLMVYQRDQKWRLMSVDPDTGDTRWEVSVPEATWSDQSSFFLITDRRVYLPNKSFLHIFDLATGRLQGSIGGQ